MSVSSSTRCDAVSVSSQMDTHIAEVQAGVTLSVNALEFWHARGPSRLALLVNDLICAPALQAYVERMFSVCLGDEEAGRGRKSVSGVSVQVSRDKPLSKLIQGRQWWKKRPADGKRLSKTCCY